MPIEEIALLPMVVEDLPVLFRIQLDEEARRLVAFTPLDSLDEAAYVARHATYLKNADNHNRTIWANGRIVGSIYKFLIDDKAEIAYWIDRTCWGRGIGTAALRKFLELEATRPLHGRAAFDNLASRKTLLRCGFREIGTDKGFANARQIEVEEFVYQLSR